jgi:hypothetical protein
MHKTMEWTDIEESVRLIMELPLSSDEQMLLEKQEKSLKIIIDEL